MAGKASLKMWIGAASNFSLIPSCSICQSCWQSKLFGKTVSKYRKSNIISIYYYSNEKVPFCVVPVRAEAFLVFNRRSQPTLSWHITDMLPTVGRQLADKQPTVSQLLAENFRKRRWMTVGHLSTNSRPTVGWQFFGWAVLHFFPFSRVHILIKHEIRKYHIEVGNTTTKNCTSS